MNQNILNEISSSMITSRYLNICLIPFQCFCVEKELNFGNNFTENDIYRRELLASYMNVPIALRINIFDIIWSYYHWSI